MRTRARRETLGGAGGVANDDPAAVRGGPPAAEAAPGRALGEPQEDRRVFSPERGVSEYA